MNIETASTIQRVLAQTLPIPPNVSKPEFALSTSTKSFQEVSRTSAMARSRFRILVSSAETSP